MDALAFHDVIITTQQVSIKILLSQIVGLKLCCCGEC